MARCENCLHYHLCVNIESQHLRIILAGNKADERCKLFKSTADVVPTSEVEGLNKELDELAEEHSDLIVEKDQLFDIAEKQKVEIEALKIANEKMYAANKAQAMEIFAEIEEGIKAAISALQFANPTSRKIKHETLLSLMRFIKTIEKKYTEGEHEP